MMRSGLFAKISLAKVEGHGEAIRADLKKITVTVRVLRVTEKKGCRKKKVLGSFRKATFIRKRKGALIKTKLRLSLIRSVSKSRSHD